MKKIRKKYLVSFVFFFSLFVFQCLFILSEFFCLVYVINDPRIVINCEFICRYYRTRCQNNNSDENIQLICRLHIMHTVQILDHFDESSRRSFVGLNCWFGNRKKKLQKEKKCTEFILTLRVTK